MVIDLETITREDAYRLLRRHKITREQYHYVLRRNLRGRVPDDLGETYAGTLPLSDEHE